MSESFRDLCVFHPSGLATLPNECPAVELSVFHRLSIPPCCPVSKNPLKGSKLEIRYVPGERLLEVYRLKQYVASFVGGHPDGTRNMEAMVQKIARDVAEAVGVPVTCRAVLKLHPDQEMELVVYAEPAK